MIVVGLPSTNRHPAIRWKRAPLAMSAGEFDEELVKTIRAVHSGEAHVSPGVAAAMIARMAELSDGYAHTASARGVNLFRI